MIVAAQGTDPLSIILLDVDHFKKVNDRYGHPIGDKALQHIAFLLGQNMPQAYRAGRWGGEEFMIVLPGTTMATARTIAEEVRTRVTETPLPLDHGEQLALTISLGVASTPPHTILDFKDLFSTADKGLYKAKGDGRNRVCALDPDFVNSDGPVQL